MLYPSKMVEIPRNSLAQAAGNRLARLPSKFVLDLGYIHGIAALVAWPVFDERNQACIRLRGGLEVVKEGADLPHNSRFDISCRPPMLYVCP